MSLCASNHLIFFFFLPVFSILSTPIKKDERLETTNGILEILKDNWANAYDWGNQNIYVYAYCIWSTAAAMVNVLSETWESWSFDFFFINLENTWDKNTKVQLSSLIDSSPTPPVEKVNSLYHFIISCLFSNCHHHRRYRRLLTFSMQTGITVHLLALDKVN